MNKTLMLKNDISEIKKITDFLCKVCEENDICNKILCDATLAIEEIFANIVHYAYEDKNEHLVKISIKIGDDNLTLEIIDDGKPFNPLEAPSPDTHAPFEEREVGGLGIHLVRNITDELEYTRVKGKNVLKMKVRLQ
ncbi:MAG: ATP-binding protein [Desulfobacterales bacterium]|jgi:anti-sigma regulatory factor (Ser/Thr protein kinase)